jgi:hypothetical protein
MAWHWQRRRNRGRGEKTPILLFFSFHYHYPVLPIAPFVAHLNNPTLVSAVSSGVVGWLTISRQRTFPRWAAATVTAIIFSRDTANWSPMQSTAAAMPSLRRFHEMGIDTGAWAEHTDCSGPLQTVKSIKLAILLGRADVIRLLHELGAGDVNAVDDATYATPAHFVAMAGHLDVIRALGELGADLNIPDNDGFTPVHIAVTKGRVEAIRALCELGADVNTAKVPPLLCFQQLLQATSRLFVHCASMGRMSTP